jgi:hypothetical protein
MEKELENSKKKKRRKQPKLAQPGCAPAPPPRLSAVVLPRACPPSLARCPVGPIYRRQFPSPSLSLSVSWARIASRRAIAPRAPSSLSAPWACPVSSAPSALAVVRRVCTRARRRISRPRRLPTRPAPFIEPRQCPAHPSPHFVQLRPLSHSAHAASRRRRPAPAFPAIPLTGDRSKPPRALPRGETSVLVPNFPYCALCSANFTFAGARPRRSAVLARWPANLAWSSSLE